MPKAVKRGALVLSQVAFVLLLLGLWEHASSAGWVDPFFFGRPSQIWDVLVKWWQSGTLLRDVWATTVLLLLGFGAGMLIGVVIGVCLGASRLFRDVFEPFVIFFNAVPRIILFPFLIVWLGFGLLPEVVAIVLVMVPTVAINVAAGIREVEGEYLDNQRALGASRLNLAREVYIPSIALWLLTTSRVTFAFAFQAAIVAEILVAREGLGYQITEGKSQYDVNTIYAAMALIVVLAVAVDVIFSGVERRATRWQPSH
jgi:NitT/TauT family transport system permease protein